jgi:alanyl-tRNA synthetase
MGAEADIRDAIQKLSGATNDHTRLVACTVVSVDMNSRTCTGTTITGTSEIDIDNIQIMPGVSDGFILIPAVGSMVYVAYSRRNLPFIAMFAEVDKVLLICDNVVVNDGSFGGLVKITELTSKLNNLVSKVQQELVKIQTAGVSVGMTYTPGTLDQFQKSDYENTKFKHGE